MRAFRIAIVASMLCGGLILHASELTAHVETGALPRKPPGIQPLIVPIRYAKASDIKEFLDAAIAFIVAEGQDDMIKGNTKVIADARTNILFILTHPVNMPMIERMIQVLDVEVESDKKGQHPSGP